MGVHGSARKNGISDDDIHAAGEQYLIAFTIDDDQPARELRLGFDTHGRLLEIVVVLLDNDAELVIHAMKPDPSTSTCCHETKGDTPHDRQEANPHRRR